MKSLNEEIYSTANPVVEKNPFAQFGMAGLNYVVQLHMYHWQAKNNSIHVNLGELYESIHDSVDEYVEASLGAGLFTLTDFEPISSLYVVRDFSSLDGTLSGFSGLLTDTISMVKDQPQFQSVLDKLVDMQEAINKFNYLKTQV